MSIPYFSCSCGVNDEDDDEVPTVALVLPTTTRARITTKSTSTNNNHNKRSTSTVLRNSNSHGTFATEESGSDSSGSNSNRENRKTSAKNNNNTMRRASISRRNDHMASPPMRSRSQERHQENNHHGHASSSSSSNLMKMMEQQEEDLHSRAIENVHDSSSSSSRIHRRSASDPFDAQQGEENNDNNNLLAKINSAAAASSSLPRQQSPPTLSSSSSSAYHYLTLPRYPVAETRDKNCWSETPVSLFNVRGCNYFVDQKKEPSKHYLMSCRGCDLFLSDKAGDILDLTAIGDHILGGRLRSLPTVLVNFRFPWGVLILYYEVPEKLRPYMLQEESAAANKLLTRQELVLAKWLQGDADYKNDRLKLISYVAEGPWVVRNMVPTGRPALIGKKLPVTYSLDKGGRCQSSRHHHHHGVVERQPLLQCTLDIGSSSTTAKRIVSVCRRYMSSLTVDIGFVIQAEESHELPEQMMGSTRVHGVDPLKAPQL